MVVRILVEAVTVVAEVVVAKVATEENWVGRDTLADEEGVMAVVAWAKVVVVVVAAAAAAAVVAGTVVGMEMVVTVGTVDMAVAVVEAEVVPRVATGDSVAKGAL